MPAQTFICVTDPYGNQLFETAEFLEIGNNPGLHYVLACGQVGALTATIPPEFNGLLLKDSRVHVMRSVNGAPAQREGGSCFLARRWDYADNYTTITALHANDLIRRRHVLYNFVGINDGGVATGAADDAIKTAWKDNCTTVGGVTLNRAPSTVTGAANATQTDISAYVSVQANLTAAPVLGAAKYLFWRNLLDCFLELEQYSFTAGTYLTAEIVAPTERTLELQTFTGQRGVDRRASTGNGLVFSSARGNLENALLTVDATEEKTFALALGAGQVTQNRYSAWAIDTGRMGQSPFGRTEGIIDASSTPNTAALTDEASAGLRAGWPFIQAAGDLVETDTCVRGVHYNFGDFVTVQVAGVLYDMRLDLLDVTLSSGSERTIARFNYNSG